MKNNLGKLILFLVILLHVELFALEYEWKASISKTNAFVNEAVYLKYTCSFNDHAVLYSIEFNPVGSYEDYDIILLTDDKKIKNGKKINTYEFVAFMKKAGNISFDFTAVMKKTNEDSIKNTVLGRDNAFYEEFVKTELKQKSLAVNVKDTNASIVGTFKMSVSQDSLHVKAFEPFHMEVVLKGVGNLDKLKPLEFKIPDVKVFTSKIIKDIKLTKDGYYGSIRQKFAFVSDKDFVVPKIEISYFDIKTMSLKALSQKALHVEIDKGYDKDNLLDKVQENSFDVNYEYLYYILFFIFGFLLSKIKFKTHIKQMTDDEVLLYKIKKSKNMDEVLICLLLSDEDKYKTLIKKIENNEIKSKKEVKKELITHN